MTDQEFDELRKRYTASPLSVAKDKWGKLFDKRRQAEARVEKLTERETAAWQHVKRLEADVELAALEVAFRDAVKARLAAIEGGQKP